MPRVTPDVESSPSQSPGQDAPESAIRAAQLSTVWFDRDLGWLEFNRRVLGEALTDAQRREAGEYFDAQVSAALTPLVILPSQPFPFFSNLSLSLTFVLH